MKIWRMCKAIYSTNPFNGIGGMHGSGRWHSKGTLISYAATDPSLPILETLVHVQDSIFLSSIQFSIIEATLNDSHIEELDHSLIPTNWGQSPPSLETQRIGDRWIKSMSSVGLLVPSKQNSTSKNILLNPSHPDANSIIVNNVSAYKYDDRLNR